MMGRLICFAAKIQKKKKKKKTEETEIFFQCNPRDRIVAKKIT
jgi:hypothetical protein